MKKSIYLKASIIAILAIAGGATYYISQKEIKEDRSITPPRSCQQESCRPPEKTAPEYIFYESSSHAIAAVHTQ